MFAVKTLLNQYLRFIITVFGIALCVILMLFILSIYKGSADGAVQYIRSSKTDIWILQNNATNILRNTSLLSSNYGKTLSAIEGIESVSPVLFLLASVRTKQHPASVYLAGYDLQSAKGGPPAVFKGRNISKDNEIVLDRSFAAKYKIRIGDQVYIKNDTLIVTGLSSGTNMFVLQYAFVTLSKAKELFGFSGLVSAYMINTKPVTKIAGIINNIKEKIPNANVFDNSTFLENNNYEVKSGILPLLFIVAMIGGVVLTAILSLILSVNVLEQRKDYAIMKALGGSAGFISGMIVKQALMLTGCGMLLALILFFPICNLVESITPEISAVSSFLQVIAVTISLVIISLISSIIPGLKLRQIYPLEVFQ